MRSDSRKRRSGRRVFLVAMVLSVAAHAAALGWVRFPVETAPDRPSEAREADRAEPPRAWQEEPLRVVDLRTSGNDTRVDRRAAESPAPEIPEAADVAPAGGGDLRRAIATVAMSVRPVSTAATAPALLASRTNLERRMDRAVRAFRDRMESRGARREFGGDEPRVRIRGGFGRGGIGGGPGCSTPPLAGGTDRNIGDYFPGR